MSTQFRPVTLDNSSDLLKKGYQLRFQSYCLERHFLNAADYPNQLEFDEFDRHSVHVGVVDGVDEFVGTARLVMPNPAGLPYLKRCTLFPPEAALVEAASLAVEISRVCIIRRYSRRRDDAFFEAPAGVQVQDQRPNPFERDRRQDSSDVFATLIRATYLATKRLGASHWIVAIEKSLRRRIERYGLPFHVAGPEIDYYGRVSPYTMSLAELDERIRTGLCPWLDDLLLGWEATLQPAPNEHAMALVGGA